MNALGVGHSRIASVSVVPGCITPVVVEWRPLEAASPDVAVGHFRASSPRHSPPRPFGLELSVAPALGVGQHEHPLSAVGSSDLGRTNTRPFRIEPEVGQSSQESSKPIPGNEASDVFHEDEPGSHFANQPKELVDEVALVVAALLLSGNRVRLARDASSDDVHQATKRPSIEGGQIIENRRAAQGLVFHPRQEDGLGVGVPLDVAHRAGSEDALEGEVQAPDS